jgi:hypothetical protein
LLLAGQLNEADPPNQQTPLPTTPNQSDVDDFHPLSRELSLIL